MDWQWNVFFRYGCAQPGSPGTPNVLKTVVNELNLNFLNSRSLCKSCKIPRLDFSKYQSEHLLHNQKLRISLCIILFFAGSGLVPGMKLTGWVYGISIKYDGPVSFPLLLRLILKRCLFITNLRNNLFVRINKYLIFIVVPYALLQMYATINSLYLFYESKYGNWQWWLRESWPFHTAKSIGLMRNSHYWTFLVIYIWMT